MIHFAIIVAQIIKFALNVKQIMDWILQENALHVLINIVTYVEMILIYV